MTEEPSPNKFESNPSLGNILFWGARGEGGREVNRQLQDITVNIDTLAFKNLTMWLSGGSILLMASILLAFSFHCWLPPPPLTHFPPPPPPPSGWYE